MSHKKIRPMGELLLELEGLVEEMVCHHELQYGDILNLVYGYLEVMPKKSTKTEVILCFITGQILKTNSLCHKKW